MAFRDQALEAMGLTPAWVLRTPAVPAARGGEVAADGVALPAPAGVALPAESRIVMPAIGTPPPPAAASAAVAGDVAERPAGAAQGQAADRLQAINAMTMDTLRGAFDVCNACGLCATRRQAVPGAGRVPVPWMLVGEGPGADDEELGTPFNGTPGRLLEQMLGELGLARQQEVYITNAVKCRVPDHGRPDAQALAACRPHLVREIALVQPRVILALGASAAHVLLETAAPVGSLRGQVHRRQYGGHEVAVVVTFHPAYVLRKLTEKARVWDDLCLARQHLMA